MARSPMACAALLSLGPLTAACTATPPEVWWTEPPSIRPSPTVAPLIAGSCPKDGAGLVPPFQDLDHYAGSLPPDGFRPERVIRCVVADEWPRSDGRQVYLVQASSADPSTALLGVLRLPDTGEPRGPVHVACPANASPILFLILVGPDGRGYRPRIPIDFCHEPRPEVTKAVDGIEWRADGSYQVVR